MLPNIQFDKRIPSKMVHLKSIVLFLTFFLLEITTSFPQTQQAVAVNYSC